MGVLAGTIGFTVDPAAFLPKKPYTITSHLRRTTSSSLASVGVREEHPHPLGGAVVVVAANRWVFFNFNKALNASRSWKGKARANGSPGLYSAQSFELTAENVDLVLEDVRPYLIADGGNVDVVSVQDGVISLKLQGACGSCPSSTTTMKMGIERVLKEKFGEAIKDICQVSDDQQSETTVETVNGHLDILRPAIKSYGGSIEVLSIQGGDCYVRYMGPQSIGSGIKAAIKERFPDIVNVFFSD
ncbi:nifU-like protein 1, chloroplastic [Telopea speciosissima]|uniref:nifU-like protein 1, chloroplastic n=1 Tax=Telopea speciosissima TaxID=54955 RepID=UPI001CC42FA9|nr:nifU-like protein 1, chloroplastic [Telopea speciosissima]